MKGFSWVIDGELAAMPVPGGSRDLAEDLDFIASQRITTLVSLTETPIDPAELAQRDVDAHHIPVKDFTAPTLEQMNDFVTIVAEHAKRGERVGVHCTGGLGRSGTMAAATFVSRGVAPAAAIARIRQLRPGSIETASQEQAIHDFARYLGELGARN